MLSLRLVLALSRSVTALTLWIRRSAAASIFCLSYLKWKFVVVPREPTPNPEVLVILAVFSNDMLYPRRCGELVPSGSRYEVNGETISRGICVGVAGAASGAVLDSFYLISKAFSSSWSFFYSSNFCFIIPWLSSFSFLSLCIFDSYLSIDCYLSLLIWVKNWMWSLACLSSASRSRTFFLASSSCSIYGSTFFVGRFEMRLALAA